LPTSRITELQDVREATNPTPGEPEALVRARETVNTARQQWQDARDAGNWTKATEAYDQLDQAWQELDAVQSQKLPPGPGGFTLREDVKPRAQRETEAAAEAAHQSLQDRAFNHPDVQAAGQKAMEADAAYKAAKASGDQAAIDAANRARSTAYHEHARIQRQVMQDLEAGSTVGPGQRRRPSPARRTTDRLASVNRALGQGGASYTSGGVGAAVGAATDPGSPQGEDESDAAYAARRARERAQRMATGFAVGAVAPCDHEGRQGRAQGGRQGSLRAAVRWRRWACARAGSPTPEQPNRALAIGADPPSATRCGIAWPTSAS
jgi:hypothetical protein